MYIFPARTNSRLVTSTKLLFLCNLALCKKSNSSKCTADCGNKKRRQWSEVIIFSSISAKTCARIEHKSKLHRLEHSNPAVRITVGLLISSVWKDGVAALMEAAVCPAVQPRTSGFPPHQHLCRIHVLCSHVDG